MKQRLLLIKKLLDNINLNYSGIITILILLIIGCQTKNQSDDSSSKNRENVFNIELGIEAVPEALGVDFSTNFNRYTKVLAPNGKPIHIVIQDDITNEQIIRCRNILTHFLRDYPGSKYGSDKSNIANAMANNEAKLALLNGEDDGKNLVKVDAQYLFKNEIQVEGHQWYVNQDYEHRDASYEEILHFVHDYGIGVDGHNTMQGAAAEFQQEIRAAQENALENKLWADHERAEGWIKELTAENSLSQEYLAAVIDTYYGLWGAWQESEDKGMQGLYVSKVRSEIQNEDPMGWDLVDNVFFHPYLTYNARIHPEFKGAFSLKFDSTIRYTHHSRYLKNVTLLGEHDTDIEVNELNNDITGNQGTNTVIFSGASIEYAIEMQTDRIEIKDSRSARDGNNTLRKIEKMKFTDKIVDVQNIGGSK